MLLPGSALAAVRTLSKTRKVLKNFIQTLLSGHVVKKWCPKRYNSFIEDFTLIIKLPAVECTQQYRAANDTECLEAVGF